MWSVWEQWSRETGTTVDCSAAGQAQFIKNASKSCVRLSVQLSQHTRSVNLPLFFLPPCSCKEYLLHIYIKCSMPSDLQRPEPSAGSGVVRMATGQSPPGQSPPRSEAPLVLVTPVKRPADEMPYAVKSPPRSKAPHTQNVFLSI